MVPNKKTLLKKYNVDHPSKIPGVQEKKKMNSFRKHHLESPNQIDIVKIKKKQTLLNNYGLEGFSNNSIIQKRIRTCIKRYGVSNVQKLPLFQKKRQETLNRRFDENRKFDA